MKAAYFSDAAWVEQHALSLLHELEEVAAPNLHRPKGGQQGSEHVALGIRIVLSLLQVSLHTCKTR